jgi:alpha-tubulin suppressor-like RCC1 family protein
MGAVGAALAPATPAAAAQVWLEVDAGYDLTCGVKQNRTMWCWGFGGSVAYYDPVRMGNAADWASVSVGGGHMCALKTSGEPYCWGANYYGQLGTGDNIVYQTPRAVAIARDLVSISAGGTHTCGISTEALLYCWGDNRNGGLGLGTTTDWTSPRLVSGGWSAVSAGDFNTCGITTAGRAYCWGSNYFQQLGLDSDVDQVTIPTSVAGGGTWSAIDTGAGHSCGVQPGGLYCWGANTSGELGTGYPDASGAPVRVSANAWASVDADGLRDGTGYDGVTCGLYSNGTRFCWGYNRQGQLGIGDTTDRHAPRRLTGEGSWTKVTVGGSHACGLRTGGTLQCWGDNDWGQLGLYDRVDRLRPATVG